jgi:hypothetical protein
MNYEGQINLFGNPDENNFLEIKARKNFYPDLRTTLKIFIHRPKQISLKIVAE